MKLFRFIFLVAAMALVCPVRGDAQELPWVVDGTLGYAGFVDDATKHLFAVAGGARKHVTPRVSIGPEFVFMQGGDDAYDRVVMLTGNVVFDFHPVHGSNAPRVTPFVVGGFGGFWNRDQVGTGSFWAFDPAFTAGGGVRVRLADRVSAAGEYRIGWELHQRLTASISVEFD